MGDSTFKKKNLNFWCFVQLVTFTSKFNPSTSKSDQHLISPKNITPEPDIKLTRIKKMINN